MPQRPTCPSSAGFRASAALTRLMSPGIVSTTVRTTEAPASVSARSTESATGAGIAPTETTAIRWPRSRPVHHERVRLLDEGVGGAGLRDERVALRPRARRGRRGGRR